MKVIASFAAQAATRIGFVLNTTGRVSIYIGEAAVESSHEQTLLFGTVEMRILLQDPGGDCLPSLHANISGKFSHKGRSSTESLGGKALTSGDLRTRKRQGCLLRTISNEVESIRPVHKVQLGGGGGNMKQGLYFCFW